MNPDATDDEAVYQNNRLATAAALAMGSRRGPDVGLLRAVERPENPYFDR